MIDVTVHLALGMLAIALVLNLWRLLRGPDPVDRVLALDTLYIDTVAILIVYGVHLRSDRFAEAALLIALLGFISTVALSKYMLNTNIIE